MKILTEFQSYVQNRNKKIRDEFKKLEGGTEAKAQFLQKKYGFKSIQSVYKILKGKPS